MGQKLKVFIFTLLILIIGASSFIFLKTAPKKNITISSQELKGVVEIKYDEFGVSHIYATNEEDAYFSLGFVMARDRLWQMEILRRAAAGRLSEILGDKTIEIDKLMRKLFIRRSQVEYLKNNKHLINPKAMRLAGSFLRGLNHYIANENLSLEFTILGFNPEKWSFEDVLSIGGVVTLSFAEGIIADSLMASLLQDFDRPLLEELVVKMKGDKVYQNFNKQKSQVVIKETLSQLDSLLSFARPLGLFKGSNSWVVSGKKTQSGKALLSNDPHIGFSKPGFWYEAHIQTPSFELYGHYLPGVPFAGLGHNDKMGWAITMSEIDDIDLYIEKIDPKNPNAILYKGQSVVLERFEEVIKVKNSAPINLTVARGPHGPIVDETKYDQAPKSGFLPAIKWSYLRKDNHLINTLFGLNRMESAKDLAGAIKHATAPGFNISIADAEGNIGWHVMGAIPVRPEGVSGAFPMEGWHGEHDYIRYLDIMENPHLYNPEKGYIVSANYYPEVDFGHQHEGFFQPSERYERLENIFAAKSNWSVEEIKKVFVDNYFQGHDEITNAFISDLDQSKPALKAVAKELKNWDGKCEVSSIGCSYFMYLTRKINKLALIDQMGEERYHAFTKVADYWHFFKNLIKDPQSRWWDDSRTTKLEKKKDIVNMAAVEMISDFDQRFGKNAVTWGELHQLTFEHLLGKVKPLNYLFNKGPYPIGGGYSIVNNLASARADEGFSVAHGPSTRRIVDFINPKKTQGILPIGNSGNIFDPHAHSQIDLYLKGEFRSQYMMGKQDIESDNVIKLKPVKL